MKITAEPRSDQLNADDLVGGPRTVTIAEVVTGKAEQKYDIHLADEIRVWRPPLTVLRVLLSAWGDDSTDWVGRRATLFCDPAVRFGKEEVGGIRISHLSNIPAAKLKNGVLRCRVTEGRGKLAIWTIKTLPDAAPVAAPSTPFNVGACNDVEELRSHWADADPETRALIEARVFDLKAEQA